MLNQEYNYNPDGINFKKRSYRMINGLELILVLTVLFTLIGVFIWGFTTQELKNKDLQKQIHIEKTLLIALSDFYQNTGAVESARFYPVARCSAELNEVDYEFTLRYILTGKVREIDQHQYIIPNKFPIDKNGVYSTTYRQRQVPFRCQEKLTSQNNQQDTRIYDDFNSCNFSRQSKLNNCYLYTSSPTGDSFQIGYYSESTKCFIVYRKFRNSSVQLSQECV
jgi:hypothetical protein